MLYLVVSEKAYLLINLSAMKKTKLVSELRLALEQGLRANGHTRTGKIQVGYDGEVIFVEGKVKSYYQKQMVFNVVKKIVGMAEIRDDVTVD